MGSAWWNERTCVRKKRYPSYASAKEALQAAQERAVANSDPKADLLGVYRCPVEAGLEPHYHIGHATGAARKRIEKRLEKGRRKSLWKGEGAPSSSA